MVAFWVQNENADGKKIKVPGSKGFCVWKDLLVYFISSFSTIAGHHFFLLHPCKSNTLL